MLYAIRLLWLILAATSVLPGLSPFYVPVHAESRRISAEPIEDQEMDLSFTSMQVETPHVKWARPYAGGTTSVAFFLEGRDAAREVVELAQRFDLHVASSLGSFHSPLYDTGIYYGRLNPTLVQKYYNTLLGPERNYEVLVFSGGVWDQLTDFSKARAIEMVRGGTGLVWIDPSPGDPAAWEMLPLDNRGKAVAGPWSPDPNEQTFLTSGIPWPALPPAPVSQFGEVKADIGDSGEVVASCEDQPLALLSEFGKGRVVTLTYLARGRDICGLIPRGQLDSPISYPYWEYLYGLVGRAILHAAHKDSPASFLPPKLPKKFRTETSSAQPLALGVQSAEALNAKLSAEFLDALGRTLAANTLEVTLKAGRNTLAVALPPLPAGLNLGHFILKSDKGVLDWLAVALSADASASLGTLALSKDAYPRGEALHGEVRVKADNLAGLVLEATLTDGYNRELSRVQMPVPADKTATLDVPLTHAISMCGLLDVSLKKNEVILDRKQARFIVTPPRGWDEFESVMWAGGTYHGGHPHLFDQRVREMKRMGMTGIVMNPYDYAPSYWDAVIRNDMKIVTKGGDEGVGRLSAKFGALLSMWGDEQQVREDLSAEGIAAFRDWARTVYPSVDALNEIWNTRFQSWEEVEPVTKLEEAIQRNQTSGGINFAPWADYRRHLDCGFAQKFQLAREALERGDPEARQGLSGTQVGSTLTGNDWWLLTRVFKALMSYGGGDQFRQHRSFSAMPLVPWSGYGKKGPRVRHTLWSLVFQDMDGVGFFSESTFLNPDFTWFEGAKDTCRALEEIQAGPGKLLIHSHFSWDAIAFHYSQRSFHGAFALGHEKTLFESRANMTELLSDLGYQHFYLSYEQVERGELTPKKAKIFFMPCSIALSDKEARAIREYVAEGGTVVADLLPAAMDDHCRATLPGPLDEVFGIQRVELRINSGNFRLARAKASDSLPVPDLPLECTAQEAGLAPKGAEVLALESESRVPALLFHRYGKGQAIGLNANLFSRYEALRHSRSAGDFGPKVDAMESLMAAILAAAGLTPRIRLRTEGGEPLNPCSLFVHTSGNNNYVGLLRKRSGHPPQKVTVEFPEAAYVHEVIQSQAYGHVASVPAVLHDDSIFLFARLPYEVKGVELKAGAPSCRAGEAFRAAAQILADAEPGAHVVRLEVWDASGKPVAHYAKNLLFEKGKGEVFIPFALNDLKGTWTLRLTDVATGVKAGWKVEVK